MKSKKAFIILFYVLPYAYMAMAIDILKGSVLSYALMMLIQGALAMLSFRSRNLSCALVGNIISFASSYFLTLNFPVDSQMWNCFFKPFSPAGMVKFLYIISITIQIIILIINKKAAC